jgi:hypothetical protein
MKKTFLATIAAALIASTAAPALAAQGGGQGKGDGPRHGPRIERMMERFDADRDGAVVLEEVSAHRLAMFESADTDKNGSLSKDELKAFGEMRKEMRQQNREERRAERQGKMDGDRAITARPPRRSRRSETGRGRHAQIVPASARASQLTISRQNFSPNSTTGTCSIRPVWIRVSDSNSSSSVPNPPGKDRDGLGAHQEVHLADARNSGS